MKECKHSRWQYCRRILPNGSQHFGAQCMDCMDVIKLERHGFKLWLKTEDIPANAPIHAWIDLAAQVGQGGLFDE